MKHIALAIIAMLLIPSCRNFNSLIVHPLKKLHEIKKNEREDRN